MAFVRRGPPDIEALWFVLRCQTDTARYAEVERFRPLLTEAVVRNVLQNAARCATGQVPWSCDEGEQNPSEKNGAGCGQCADAYQQLFDEGWGSVSVSQEIGGQGLPVVLQAALHDVFFSTASALWSTAQTSMIGLALIFRFGSAILKSVAIPRLLSGAWALGLEPGVLCVPASSETHHIQSVPCGDGPFRLRGGGWRLDCVVHGIPGKVIQVFAASERLPDHPQVERAILVVSVPFVSEGGADEFRDEWAHWERDDFDGAITWKLANVEDAGPFLADLKHPTRLLSVMQTVARLRRTQSTLINGYGPNAARPVNGGPEEVAAKTDAFSDCQLEALRAVAYAYAAAIDMANMHPEAEVQRTNRQFLSLISPVVDGWLWALESNATEGLLALADAGAWTAGIHPTASGSTASRLSLVARALLEDHLVPDGGKAFRGWLQGVYDSMRTLDHDSENRLCDISLPLSRASERLQRSVEWSIAHIADCPHEVMARSGGLLALFAAVLGAVEMARLATVADRELKQGVRAGASSILHVTIDNARHYAMSELTQVTDRILVAPPEYLRDRAFG